MERDVTAMLGELNGIEAEINNLAAKLAEKRQQVYLLLCLPLACCSPLLPSFSFLFLFCVPTSYNRGATRSVSDGRR